MSLDGLVLKALFAQANQAQHALWHVVMENTTDEQDDAIAAAFIHVGVLLLACERVLTLLPAVDKEKFQTLYGKLLDDPRNDGMRKAMYRIRQKQKHAVKSASAVVDNLFKKGPSDGNEED